MGSIHSLRDLPRNSLAGIEKRISMKRLAQFALVVGIVLLAFFLYLFYDHGKFTVDKNALLTSAKDITSFIAMFFSLASILLVLENLKVQGRNAEVNMVLTQKSHFEKTFFDLISLQNQITRDIDTTVESPTEGKEIVSKGRGFFDDISDAVTYDYDHGTDRGRAALVRVYMGYFTVHNSDMAHYYRNLYNLVRYVVDHPYFDQIRDRTDLKLMQRDGYFRIIRAQLTNAELTCLALNGMTEQGASFRTYLEDYELLKNLNFELTMPEDYYRGVPAPEVLAQAYPHLFNVLAEQKERAGEGAGV